MSRSDEDTALSEGLTLADLLDVLGTADDAGLITDDGDAHKSPALGLRERVQAWTELAAAWGAGPQGSWRAW
jgi:hypothetical protein